MLITDKIPQHIYDSLGKEGIDTDKIMLASYCDMNADHVLCDTYVIATTEKLFIVSGSVRLSGENKAPGKLDKIWCEDDFREYDIENIERLKLEELSSSARLTAKMKSGEYIFLTAMTNSCRASLLCFIKYFDRIKKGDITDVDFEVDPEDDPKANCCPKCGMRYPDKNRKICPKCMEKGKLYKRFGSFLVKYKKYIAIMILSLVLLTLTGILTP